MEPEQSVDAASVHSVVIRVLTGRWRVSEHGIFCGTLRIAKFDFDTNPSDEFKQQVFAQIEHALNRRFVSGDQVFDHFGIPRGVHELEDGSMLAVD